MELRDIQQSKYKEYKIEVDLLLFVCLLKKSLEETFL